MSIKELNDKIKELENKNKLLEQENNKLKSLKYDFIIEVPLINFNDNKCIKIFKIYHITKILVDNLMIYFKQNKNTLIIQNFNNLLNKKYNFFEYLIIKNKYIIFNEDISQHNLDESIYINDIYNVIIDNRNMKFIYVNLLDVLYYNTNKISLENFRNLEYNVDIIYENIINKIIKDKDIITKIIIDNLLYLNLFEYFNEFEKHCNNFINNLLNNYFDKKDIINIFNIILNYFVEEDNSFFCFFVNKLKDTFNSFKKDISKNNLYDINIFNNSNILIILNTIILNYIRINFTNYKNIDDILNNYLDKNIELKILYNSFNHSKN